MQQQGVLSLGYLSPHYSIYKIKWGGLGSVVFPGKCIYSNCSVFLERKEKVFRELFEYYKTKNELKNMDIKNV